jgi:hypothetical protein
MVFLYEATLRSALKDHTSMATPRWRRPDGDGAQELLSVRITPRNEVSLGCVDLSGPRSPLKWQSC